MRLSVGLETYQTGLAQLTYLLMCSKTDIQSLSCIFAAL